MTLSKKLLLRLVSGVVAVFMLLGLIPGVLDLGTVSAQEFPPYNHIHVKARIEFTGITKDALFDFITNMENDELWWDGVESTELVAGSLDGDFDDRAYLQSGSFSGFPYTNVIDITGGQEGVFMSLEAQSPFLAYDSRYDFHEESGKAVVTSTSFVEGYGLTPELMSFTIDHAFDNLTSYLGVESEYTLITGEYIMNGL